MAGGGISGSGRGVELTLSFPGGETVRVRLSRFRDAVSDMRPFWNGPFKTIWFEDQRRGFATGGLATGGSWKPLTPLYAVVKAKRFPGQPVLTATGHLREGLTSPTAPDAVWEAGASGIKFGTMNPIAVYHQHGTRTMPARPPIRMDQMTFEYVARELQKFLVEAWKSAKAESAQSA